MSQSHFIVSPGEPEQTLAFLQDIHGTEKRPEVPVFKGKIASRLTVRKEQLSVSAAANVGYGKVFEISSEGSSSMFILDYAMRSTVPANDPTKILLSAVYGAGFRIALAATNVKGKLELSIAGVAAQAQLDVAKVQVHIDVFGMPQLPKGTIDSTLVGFTDFNVGTVEALNSTIKKLKEYAEDPANRAHLDPQLIALNTRRIVSETIVEDARSIIFALWRISKGTTLKRALEVLKDDAFPEIKGTLVRSTYADLMRRRDMLVPNPELDVIKPTQDERTRAEKRLFGYKVVT